MEREVALKQANDNSQYQADKNKKNQDGGLQDDTEMVIESSEDLEIVKSFDELGLREELLRGTNLIIL